MAIRRRTDFIVIHCAATRPAMDVGVREIRQWHLARGFKDIGYHLVIRRNGKVERGRAIDETGAHVEGYNSRSVGICLVGGVSQEDYTKAEDNFTKEQRAALVKELARLKIRYPKARIVGHRDLNQGKACPSFDVAAFLRHNKISNP